MNKYLTRATQRRNVRFNGHSNEFNLKKCFNDGF